MVQTSLPLLLFPSDGYPGNRHDSHRGMADSRNGVFEGSRESFHDVLG